MSKTEYVLLPSDATETDIRMMVTGYGPTNDLVPKLHSAFAKLVALGTIPITTQLPCGTNTVVHGDFQFVVLIKHPSAVRVPQHAN